MHFQLSLFGQRSIFHAPEPTVPGPAGPRVVLVACVAGKRAEAAPARDLYTSDWFVKARAYAEALIAAGQADVWYILSAEHGLVTPDRPLAPYDTTLNTMAEPDRAAWGARVHDQLGQVMPATLVVLAGERYRVPVAAFASRAGVAMEVPMRGMGIGSQKAWLLAAVAALAAA